MYGQAPLMVIAHLQCGCLSFRMGHEVKEVIGIALDGEIEPPVIIDARLPDITRFVVFLGTQGRVAEIT